MDRELWKKVVKFVSVENYPLLHCPYCNSSHLRIDKESISYRKSSRFEHNTLLAKEEKARNTAVKDAFEQNAFFGILAGLSNAITSMSWIPTKFICFFKCDKCHNDVSATGTAQYPVKKENGSPTIKVEYFSPPIPIFEVDPSIPDRIKNEILQAFNHFHCDLNSSGMKLRRSIENLCDELGVKKRTLHDSIIELGNTHPTEAKLLNSLKLVGNEATHSDTVTEEDLLDAFEVQYFVLNIFKRNQEAKKVQESANRLLNKFDKRIDRKH